MKINDKIKKSNSQSLEVQAKQKKEKDLFGCFCPIIGLFIAVPIAIIVYSPLVVIIIFVISIIIGAFVYKVRNTKLNEHNRIIRETRVKRTVGQKNAEMGEKEAKEEEILRVYGVNRKTFNYGNRLKNIQVIVNEEKELVRICDKNYSFCDIIDFKITDNSKDIYTPAQYETKTNTGSMLGRAVVGGILTGGIGAIIGGATAKKETIQTKGEVHQTSHDYTIHICVNNINEPQLKIRFYSDSKSTEEFAGLLTYIINKNVKKKISIAEDEYSIQPQNLVADELLKLADLKSKGILTDEEFCQQKAKLLGF